MVSLVMWINFKSLQATWDSHTFNDSLLQTQIDYEQFHHDDMNLVPDLISQQRFQKSTMYSLPAKWMNVVKICTQISIFYSYTPVGIKRHVATPTRINNLTWEAFSIYLWLRLMTLQKCSFIRKVLEFQNKMLMIPCYMSTCRKIMASLNTLVNHTPSHHLIANT